MSTRAWLLPFLAVLVAGCDFPGQPKPQDRPVPAEEVKDFNVLYARNCAGCHGADGKLGPAPPLNDPLFLAIVPDAELVRVITEGRTVSPRQKTPMPAFGFGKVPTIASHTESETSSRQKSPLTSEQIKVLAEGIKKRWGPPVSPKGPVPPYLPADKNTHGNKDPGIRGFARACADCHGTQGKGGSMVGPVNDPAFLALISDQALRRIIITGRPDLGMPPFDGKDGRTPKFAPLTAAEVDDLVALLASWREAGPGKTQ
jgi:cytochrome c oxidase cbb3-type subunit III